MNLRKAIKRAIKNGFLVLVFPVFTLYLMFSLIGNTDSVFMSFSQTLSLIPGKIGIYIRAAFYRFACTNASDEISIGFLTIFSHKDTTIAPGVYIGPQCNIGKCTIGANTLLGSGVHILSGKKQHSFDIPNKTIQEQGGKFEKISIGEDCWLGNSAIVMANLPNHCIVAAGGVYITEEEQAWSILGGNPAKHIKSRRKENNTL